MKSKDILDSWKEIANYLGKDVTTCYRWEKELGLPIRRIDDTSSRANVFAYKSEIDSWLRTKAKSKEFTKKTIWRQRSFVLRVSIIVLIIFVIMTAYLLNRLNSNHSEEQYPNNQEFPSAFDEIRSLGGLPINIKEGKNETLRRVLNNVNDPLELYSLGKYYSEKYTQEANEIAIRLFLKALELNKDFPLAMLGLSQCYVSMVSNLWSADISWVELAERLIQGKSHGLNKYPEYFVVQAQINLCKSILFDKNTKSEALAYLNEGVAGFPENAKINFYMGKYHLWEYGLTGEENDLDRALSFMRKSYWLDPYSLLNSEYADLLMLNRDFQAAIDVCNKAKRYDETERSSFQLGKIFYYSGELELSRIIFDGVETPLYLRIPSLHYLAMIAAQKNEKRKVRSLLEAIRLVSINSPQFNKPELLLSSIYFGIGNEEEGNTHLKKYFESLKPNGARHIDLKYIELDKNFAPYRDTDEFRSGIGF